MLSYPSKLTQFELDFSRDDLIIIRWHEQADYYRFEAAIWRNETKVFQYFKNDQVSEHRFTRKADHLFDQLEAKQFNFKDFTNFLQRLKRNEDA